MDSQAIRMKHVSKTKFRPHYIMACKWVHLLELK